MSAVPESLRSLVEELPFGLDESASAGAAFERWQENGAENGDSSEKYVVDIWTYCYVRRYFLVKFAVHTQHSAADLDVLIERVYQKVDAHRAEVREARRYPHWVSVVCRNTFLNYVRRDRPASVSLDDDETYLPLPSDETVDDTVGLVWEVVVAAIEQLPKYLRVVARMRFLEERSYTAICDETGLDTPTARAYAARARKHLCENPDVKALAEDELG